MTKIQIRTSEMGESVFAAIIFLIMGIILITNPNGVVKVALYIVGTLITLMGIFRLLLYYKSNDGQKKEIISGGAAILFGMALILCVAVFFDKVEIVLRLIAAVYLLYVGIYRLVFAFKTKGDKKPYFINSILIILIAILLAVIPGMPLWAAGWFIVAYSVVEIVGFVLGRNNTANFKVAEAEIIVEKKEISTENNDVKLLK
jgi:uncharacterized membrane protein HdeD (DUF308 family)